MGLIEIDVVGPSRLRDASTASKMCLRENPRAFGWAAIGLPTLVAMTTSSRGRYSTSARPKMFSLSPIE